MNSVFRLNYIVTTLICVLGFSCQSQPETHSSDETENSVLAPNDQTMRPNIIIIMTDDQGSIDLGSYGSKDLQTPYLDKLASEGTRFTSFYAGAPVCSPSRASLLTGKYPHDAGVPGNVSARPGSKALPSSELTIAELLKEQGYRTAHIGKWHLGYTPEVMPNGQGFDYSFGHMAGCIDNYSHFFYWNGPNRHDLYRNGEEIFETGKFFPDLMVDEAKQYMSENVDAPFFMFFAMNSPHYPYQGDDKWLEYYSDLDYPRNIYNAFMSTTDERIGRLISAVDSLDIRENTLIIFQSDHGHSTEERAHFGGGNAGPFRGAKAGMFEGGLRVPAIISMPGTLPQNEIRDQLVHGSDWFASIADLVGIESPSDLSGKSVLPILKDPKLSSKHEIMHWKLGSGDRAQWAVKVGDWKLMGYTQDTDRTRLEGRDTLFLSNTAIDVGETTNLRDEYPEQVEDLLKQHREWVHSHSHKYSNQ